MTNFTSSFAVIRAVRRSFRGPDRSGGRLANGYCWLGPVRTAVTSGGVALAFTRTTVISFAGEQLYICRVIDHLNTVRCMSGRVWVWRMDETHELVSESATAALLPKPVQL